MNQGQKIQMLESFEEANFNNAFEDICVARFFFQILQPLAASK